VQLSPDADDIMKTTSLSLILLSILAAGCANAEQSRLIKRLAGSWQWEGESGGIAGDGTAPAKDGPVKTIEIRADRTIVFKTDGKETSRKRFAVSQEKSIFTDKEGPAIRFEDDDTPRIITFGKDDQTLTLADNVYDGFSRTYRRLQTTP
jgi:hypothetical protein